jgi:hypothetical protein
MGGEVFGRIGLIPRVMAGLGPATHDFAVFRQRCKAFQKPPLPSPDARLDPVVGLALTRAGNPIAG